MDNKPDCKGDHDLEWIDDSFDHEFGTEVCGHWECVKCDYVDPDSGQPPLEYEDYGDLS